jgi:hypothetical protein
MADPNDTEKTDPNAKPEAPEQAKGHHKDKGKVVTTAFGEPMSGGIADIADGDDE